MDAFTPNGPDRGPVANADMAAGYSTPESRAHYPAPELDDSMEEVEVELLPEGEERTPATTRAERDKKRRRKMEELLEKQIASACKTPASTKGSKLSAIRELAESLKAGRI